MQTLSLVSSPPVALSVMQLRFAPLLVAWAIVPCAIEISGLFQGKHDCGTFLDITKKYKIYFESSSEPGSYTKTT